MSLRNSVTDLRRGTSSSHPAPSSTGQSSQWSPGSQTTTAEHFDTCPAYHATTSSGQSVEPDPFRQFLEDTRDPNFDSEEAPPPYMHLSNGDKKPEYSRSDPAPTTGPNLSRMDGALCLRCNARKAKAWYLRQRVRAGQ